MGSFICMFQEGGYEVWFKWSTIVDAPTIIFHNIQDLESWYQKEFGFAGMRELPARIERARKTGTSAHGSDLESLMTHNRAGKDETTLSNEDLKDWLLGVARSEIDINILPMGGKACSYCSDVFDPDELIEDESRWTLPRTLDSGVG